MAEGSAQQPFKVFISYRRSDSAADARLVYERLSQRFGRQGVFLDVIDLEPGMRWLEAIKGHGRTAGVLLALIGPEWLRILTQRSHSRLEDPADDVVKLELELALSRDSGVEVIPVLVRGGTMPPAGALPRSLRALSALQAVELRHTHFDRDIDALGTALEQIAGRQSEPAPPGGRSARLPQPASVPEPPGEDRPPSPLIRPGGTEYAPDERHLETVARFLIDQGTVVPLLGPRVCGTLPDAEKIAADLARRFGLEAAVGAELPHVAQQVLVSSGRPDLVRSLRQILGSEPQPGGVHSFFARWPRELEAMGLPPRYQMIVTTDYDQTLERAFEAENEPYDLTVYQASGPHAGCFVHLPHDRDPEPITVPNRYAKFPIDDDGELERTVIVKLHGGLQSSDAYAARDNFVITEDHFIDYLSAGPVESVVPVQILAKLTESHCLFLGYGPRGWHLRVLLKRIWRGEPISARSWAIDRGPDVLEKDFWGQFGVEYYVCELEAYVQELHRQVQRRSATV